MTVAWLWLRAHRWLALLAVCCAVGVVGAVFGGELVPTPSFTAARRLSLPLGQLLPLILACAVGLHSRAPTPLFRVAPRSAAAQRTALAGVLLTTAAGACLLVPDPLSALRNTLGQAGLALATAAVAGATRSWTLPLLHLMACLLFGSHLRPAAGGGTGSQLWAFALAPAHDRGAMALALVCCAGGLLLYIARGARPEVTSDS